MVIEKIKIDDIPDLLQLYTELTPYKIPIEDSIRIYEEILRDNQYLILVAKDVDKIVGSILAVSCKCLSCGGDNFLVLEDVIVKEELRGKGIGKMLMKKIDEFAVANHCLYAIVVSSAHRKGAHKFYESVGFTDEVIGFRKFYT
ncbi:MAG: GNAT family N-acetyltransferase [Bacillota bacterium]|nr:GNAT family N-acetyltransferase [Bacillota bacterium]